MPSKPGTPGGDRWYSPSAADRKRKPQNVTLDPEVKARLDEAVKETGRPAARIIEEALGEWLDRFDRERGR